MTEAEFTVADLRKELGLTLEGFAKELGLTSKSHVHQIEVDGRCSVPVALRIEDLSSGRIPASTLNGDVRLVERARGLDTAA